MKGSSIFKLLKHRPWLLLLLAALSLGSVFLSGQAQMLSEQSASVGSQTTETPAPVAASKAKPSPIASKNKSATAPAPASSPQTNTSKANVPAAEPEAASENSENPSLTPEQQAMNQRAKAAFESSLASVDSLIEMRVAIAKGVTTLTLSVSANADLMGQNGEHLGSLTAGQTYTAQANGQSISLASQDLPSPIWIEPSPEGLFTLGDRTYRGRLLLAANDSHLWGVNFVSLKQYLYSVVASEVSPNWPPEALKAQAIAARSYGLTYHFKPVNSLYQLGDDEYFQVYSGIDREADATNRAVDETAGEFVSYRGGVVESLYAASDDIVAEAFQGRGMSQLGALELAEQGYTYEQILAKYYPGTGVGRIQQDYE
ncbi:MAG TPA: SpoIID/LytB domain-containing protein [Coleofasciculaceae cyanobacterium]|jgi:hypothetical protein